MTWLGPLRLMFLFGALVLIVLRPAPGTPPVYTGWEMIPTLLAPSIMPLLFMVVLLDAIMGAVLLSSRPGERSRYQTVIGVDLGMALLLVLWWGPYFHAIFSGRA